MRWTPGGESRDIEDRRGASRGAFGGRGIHVGIGGAILLLVLSLVFHRDFFSLVEGGAGTGTVATADSGAVAPVTSTPGEDRLVQFVSFVLDDDQKTWER